ncbi:MAG TPA: twin-arginine translocation signal domain-containing protein [Candidatus Eisenbacteria bacterium]|nr:twin-arginine translocation signal domain-containing protein [Candidatus Eisenbacteria bacterium]
MNEHQEKQASKSETTESASDKAPSRHSRRKFLGEVGGITAVTLAAGTIGLEPLLGSKSSEAKAVEIAPQGGIQSRNSAYVLSAGLMHVGQRFRVTAQLLDVASGEILWSDRIDAAAEDIVAVQDEITQRFVDGLRLKLSPDEKAGSAQPATVNPEAYEEYLRGRNRFARVIFRTVAKDDCNAAIFSRAIRFAIRPR